MLGTSIWKKRIKSFAIIFLALSLVVACYVTVFSAPEEYGDVDKFKDAKTAIEVMYLLKNSYYKPIGIGSLIAKYISTGTINGMLEVLGEDDPYTRYMENKEYDRLREDNDGVFGGVGIVIGMRNSSVTVINPINDTPAMRAGIQSGDKIIKVDDESTKDAYLDYVSSLLRGEPGTTVRVTVDSFGEIKEYEIVREVINSPATRRYMYDDKIGYIELSTFSKQAAHDMMADINYLLDQGMEALILDLRFNGGGLVDQAIELASMFIPAGPVMHVKPRSGNVITYNTVSNRVLDIPMVVIVNEYTASASEILAGALQDTGVATIVGMPSFGKGLVQSIFSLSDGSGMAVTSQIYLTAGMREITHETPIVPDIEIQVEEVTEEQLLAREQRIKEQEESGIRLSAEDMIKIDITLDSQMRTAVELLWEQLSSSELEDAA